jgi:glucuronoarabinoxylan endo-1,4-beta-xylanase
LDSSTPETEGGSGVESSTSIPATDAMSSVDSTTSGTDATSGADSPGATGTEAGATGIEAGETEAAAPADASTDSSGGADASQRQDAGKSPGTPAANAVTVNPATVYQRIDGFGASTAWGSAFNNASDPDTLWSTTTGAGLSLHRVHIDDADDSTSELSIAQKAVTYGVKVWATPWTPPAVDKSNASTIEGTLTNPQAFATYLTDFVANMKAAGVDIYAVSSQNEPDANVTYESCVYTGTTLASFVGSYIGPAFSGSDVKVMTPETQNWCDFPSFLSALEANTAAWNATSIVATHEYGCSPSAYPAIQAAGKAFWETEIYDESTTTDVDGMTSGLYVAGLIYDALTVANMNAWHYWWVYSGGTGGLYDTDTNMWTKRLWVEGNFARFVRPGYNRIAVSGTVPSGVSVAAFQNPTDATIAIVAINTNTTTTALPLFVSGTEWPSQVTPWVTSSSDSLASQTAIPVTGANFSATLAAQSVTSFVGQP